MKCIKLIKEIDPSIAVISRVSDIVAHKKVTSGTHTYVSKSEWRGEKPDVKPLVPIISKTKVKKEKPVVEKPKEEKKQPKKETKKDAKQKGKKGKK